MDHIGKHSPGKPGRRTREQHVRRPRLIVLVLRHVTGTLSLSERIGELLPLVLTPTPPLDPTLHTVGFRDPQLVAGLQDQRTHHLGADAGPPVDHVDRTEASHRRQAELTRVEDGRGRLSDRAAQRRRNELGRVDPAGQVADLLEDVGPRVRCRVTQINHARLRDDQLCTLTHSGSLSRLSSGWIASPITGANAGCSRCLKSLRRPHVS